MVFKTNELFNIHRPNYSGICIRSQGINIIISNYLDYLFSIKKTHWNIYFRAFTKRFLLVVVMSFFFSESFAEERIYIEISRESFYEIIRAIDNIPRKKDEFETTLQFNERKAEYIDTFSGHFNKCVYIYSVDATSRYNADKGELKVYTPIRSDYNKENYSVRLPSFKHKNGSTKLKGPLVLMGRDEVQSIIESHISVTVPMVSKIGTDQIKINLEPSIARKYKGKYRWVVGVLFDISSASRGDTYVSESGLELIKQVNHGYVEHDRYYKSSGQIAFIALVVEGQSEPLFEYFTVNNPKKNIQPYLKQ